MTMKDTLDAVFGYAVNIKDFLTADNTTMITPYGGGAQFPSLQKFLFDKDAEINDASDGILAEANSAKDLAQQYANNAEDVEVIPGEYSAKHFSLKAAEQVYLAQVAAQSVEDAVDVGIKQNMTFFGLNLMETL